MFIHSYNHPRFKPHDREKYRERWFDSSGLENDCFKKVLKLMQDGAGKHFLNYDFYKGNLPTIEDDLDLKGLRLQKVALCFDGTSDTFKGINFDHVQFFNCTFKKIVFYSCTANFAEFYGCTFEDCAFVFFHTLGSEFEKCSFLRADFGEPCRWENVKILNSKFDKCFFGRTTPFSDCYFDDRTKITEQATSSYHYGKKVSTSNESLAGYYQSYQLAYEASGADGQALEYYWQGKKAYTRHNITDRLEKFVQYTIEVVAGYGVKPQRPIIIMLLLYVVATLGFSFLGELSFKDSIIFTAGAIFTFGASADLLKDFGVFARLIYVSLSFSGISLIAIFITSMANLWFRSKIPVTTVKTPYNQ